MTGLFVSVVGKSHFYVIKFKRSAFDFPYSDLATKMRKSTQVLTNNNLINCTRKAWNELKTGRKTSVHYNIVGAVFAWLTGK